MLLARGGDESGRFAVLINGDRRATAFALPVRVGFHWRALIPGQRAAARGHMMVAGRTVGFAIERQGVSEEPETGERRINDGQRLVARRGHLPGLSALVPGHERRRCRRPQGRDRPRRPHRSAWRRTPSGCRPSSSRRWPTWATTCPIICAVDPLFGTLEDFDALVAEVHRHGLKLIIDQVLSHSSDRHPWFVESRADRTNPRADWYVWADPKPDGTAPSNWLSVFGGPAWEWDSTRRQYYLHNFLASQPDLNFHNAEVQDALLDAVQVLAGARRRRLSPRYRELLLPGPLAARQSCRLPTPLPARFRRPIPISTSCICSTRRSPRTWHS